ncbi:MAG: glutathione S-transferase [Gammaproteobacteria bacterium]|jgi:glutathione S-transferase
MPLQPIELISFNLCPFVQRSVITLLKKGINFKITYIDLANPPEWFLEISPLGKVPVVRYGDEVLFESAVINEFLDEITPEPMMPIAALDKAKDRAWIEYSSQLIIDQYLMSVADNSADFEKHRDSLIGKLQRLEDTIEDNGFFNGSRFSLVDTALAPLFTRFDIFARAFSQDLVSSFPKLSALAQRLLDLESVQKSVVDVFEDIYIEYLKTNHSFLAA